MEFFTAAENGMTPNGVAYTRELPSQFDEDSPNNFMRNMIMEYALESKTSAGKPGGVFKMDKRYTLAASKEVVQKYKHL